MGKYTADMIICLCIYLFILVVCAGTKLLACVLYTAVSGTVFCVYFFVRLVE